jgi:hypothetical protein
MGGFDRRGYMESTRVPEPDARFGSVSGVGRPLLAAAVVGVLVYGGYKLLKSASASADAASSDTQMVQIGQRLGDLEHRLDQLERERRAPRQPTKSIGSSPQEAPAAQSTTPTHQITFSRPVAAGSTIPAPAGPPDQSPPVSNSASSSNSDADRADIVANQQRWEATADRLGNVVGELDAQRDAIERDQYRLDELAGRFQRNSQPFTLEKTSNPQQVGPVSLRLQSTDPRNQRYTMRLSVDDTTVELKDRALHEAIQFYASGGKLTFELVVSQIGRDAVSGRLVLPQTTATR